MKIVYVGKHDSGGNDDEGAIHFALEKLGHEVVRVMESYTKGVSNLQADFLLCHHWHDLFALRQVKIPKVFWCFDLIDWPEGGQRHSQRRKWMTELTAICDLGFLTDGDWVAQDKTGKLHWLTQGADERPCDGTFDYVRDVRIKSNAKGQQWMRELVYKPEDYEFVSPQVVRPVDVLFVGGLGYGRESFVKELRERYGEKFKHVLKGCHGVALANEINRAKIVVAPDSPVTERYWSNRVYNVLRLGGFLLHPWSEGLYQQYKEPLSLVMYRKLELTAVIDRWLSEEKLREQLAGEAHRWTMKKHTYSHRCATLVQTIKEKLL